MKKILVTGGAGFIGSHLAGRLLEGNHEVFCLDDLSTGSRSNIENYLKNKRFHFYKESIENHSLVKELISQVDVIYHLAAVVGVSNVIKNPIRGININTSSSLSLIESVFLLKKQLIFASSSEVYGKNTKVPLKESTDSIFGPAYVTRWWYAVSKLLDEHLILNYCKMGFDATIVRLFNVYGPKSKNPIYSNVIPKFISQSLNSEPITVYNSGRQVRSFVYVDDVTEAFVTISKEKKLRGEIVNLGNKEHVRVVDLARKVKKLTNSKSKIIFEKKDNSFEETLIRIPDISKLSSITDYYPKTDLESGLNRTIEYFKSEI